MKKLLTTLLMGILVLSGCSGNDYKVELVDTPIFEPGTTSKITLKIIQKEKPIAGLEVTSTFEMAKMDHGSIEVVLEDQGEGLYSGEVALPMGGEWQAFLNISNGSSTKEETVSFIAEEGKTSSAKLNDNVVATIDGEPINNEDMEFYKLINTIQIEMYREADEKRYQGKELEEAMKYWDAQLEATKHPNTLLSQIIRLRAVALLALEKGHIAKPNEIDAEILKVKNVYESSAVAKAMIKEYGEEKFWNKQQSQYELIVLSSKVQQDVIDNVEASNPNAEKKEINVLAQKKYEELLVSQISTLDIQIL